MNQAHYHLILNHLPIIFPIIGLLVLTGGFIIRSEIVKRVAFLIFIFGALATIPAFATGEGAEEVVEKLQGVDQKLIKTHEEIAEIFAVLAYILGGISIIALWASWKQRSFANLISIFTIVLTVVVLFFAKQTGTTGGEIRHTEIRDANSVNNPNQNGKNIRGNDDDD